MKMMKKSNMEAIKWGEKQSEAMTTSSIHFLQFRGLEVTCKATFQGRGLHLSLSQSLIESCGELRIYDFTMQQYNKQKKRQDKTKTKYVENLILYSFEIFSMTPQSALVILMLTKI